MIDTRTSGQMYRARKAAIAAAHDENLRLYHMMEAARMRQRGLVASTDRSRGSVMSRVKSALKKTFSRRRESYESEAPGPWAKSLHQTSHIQANQQVGSKGGFTHTRNRSHR